MKRKLMVLLVTCGVMLLPVFSAQAVPVIYTSYGDYLAAIGTPRVENFEDTTLQPGLTVVTSVGYIANGVWNDRLTPGGDTTTWYQTGGFTAWGGFFDLFNPGGPGTGILITADGQVIGQIDNSYAGQFWGFTLEGLPFNSVLMSAGNQSGVAETYFSVDLEYKATPEPATLMLFGIGLLGLAGVRRFKK